MTNSPTNDHLTAQMPRSVATTRIEHAVRVPVPRSVTVVGVVAGRAALRHEGPYRVHRSRSHWEGEERGRTRVRLPSRATQCMNHPFFEHERRSLQERAHNVDELLGGFGLLSGRRLGRIQHVKPDMALDDLHHQTVQRAATRGHGLEDFKWVAVLEATLHRLQLPSDPAGTMQQLVRSRAM